MATRKSSTKEAVRLREKDLKDGVKSLYLDIYINGKRSYEYLKLYIVPAKTTQERENNKQSIKLAQSIRAKRQLEIQNNVFGFNSAFKQDLNFLDYFGEMVKSKLESLGNFANWDSVYQHLKVYAKPGTLFKDVDREFVLGFKKYLDQKNVSSSYTALSQNTKKSYFDKLKACLRVAHSEGIIPLNPASGIQGFTAGDHSRNYLTIDEVKALIKAECRIGVLKRAFLFSCLTGLRWSDIQKMTWREVHVHNGSTRIVFTQKKTKGHEYLDINDQAIAYMGERGKLEDRVFIGLKYSAWHNIELAKWCHKAGITKDITFHCARHTFAVMMLDLGAEIYTVSKLLGHKDLKVTQIYAKILDSKKIEAVQKIPDLNL